MAEITKPEPNLKNRVAPEVEEAVVSLAIDQPALGQTRASNELRERGIAVSPFGMRSILIRHDLRTMRQRLKALEAKVAQEGGALTEAQLAALEKARADKQAHGEFESEHPGHCGAQDTFDVGTPKGVGRVCRQTAIDTHSKVGFAGLCDRKTAVTAADLLNDRVIPFSDGQDIHVDRVPTDRGTEYCGAHDRQEYELYVALEDIDHMRTKARSPQTDGICERFRKSLLEEFCRVAIRQRVYDGIEALQADLDAWIAELNEVRTHEERWRYGKTPMQTFLDSKAIARETQQPGLAA